MEKKKIMWGVIFENLLRMRGNKGCQHHVDFLMEHIKMASNPEEKANVEDSVERAQWEPTHEWESRLKFVEDNLERHTLEKATQLSIVWANMNFLGCRYPVNTESLVSWYPLPSLDELRERRNRHPIKRKSQKLSENIDGPSEPKKPAPSQQDVSDLISSIRSKTEPPRVALGLVESIARKLCLCVKCIGKCENTVVKVQRVLEKHTALCNEPVEMTFNESSEGHVCVLMFRDKAVMERTESKKKDAKSAVCAELMRKVEEWQEANQLPPCKNTTPSTPHDYPPPRNEYPHYGNSYPPPNAYNRPRYPSHSHSHQPTNSYAPRNDRPSRPPYQERANYYMPPPSRGAGNHGYRGGYNQGSYY